MDSKQFIKADKVKAIAWLASLIDSLDDGKEYTIEVKERRKKRSLDANAYAWSLLNQLAAIMHEKKTDVYKRYITECGGNCEMVCCKDSAVDTLVKCWERNGLGWQAETFPSKLKGCTNVNLYYGSSVFDTKQMSIFIDSIVQDCKALGIKTLDDIEIERLVEAWEGDASE